MIKATITAPQGFRCAPLGHTVETFAQGTVVSGQVAEWAVDQKAATIMPFDPRTETKVVAPAATKSRRTRRGKGAQ